MPELLPPTLQAQAFAKANREAPEAKPAKNGRKKIDGIWLRFDDHVVVGLWKEFLSNVTKARKGFVSVKSAQWLATELNKATTPQLAALYLSNAIDNCREVLSVPAEWQQKKSESVAFVIYDHVAQEMANKETEAREDKWQSIINDGREIFADSFWFPLLEQMQNPTEDNGRWTLDVMDAEHGCLYEALVDPEFQLKVLKPNGVADIQYNFARLDNVPILRRVGAWKEQHAHFEAVNGHAFDVEAYLQAAGFRGMEHWKEIHADPDESKFYQTDPFTNEIVLPWETESFAGIWDEWKDYRASQFKMPFLSIEDEQRALLRMQIHFTNELDAFDAISMAITGGYRSIIQENVKAPAITASAFG